MNKVIPIFVLCFFASTLQAQQLAFPTAEGFGRFAKGGRGGDVYHVTTLNDSGSGSLRDGIHSATGPRTIVFDVSGTIELKSNLVIDKPFITIAGQTAPGDGITLKDRSFVLQDTHDIIVRYIRIRYGDKNKENGSDAIRTDGISNVIFDHISATWGVDAIHDLRGEKFTLQWSMYGECLHKSLHKKGAHAMLGSFRDVTNHITIHHNIFFSSRNRHPTLGGGEKTLAASVVDFRNNLNFNWKGPTNLGNCQVNVINNYYRPGLSTDIESTPFRIKAEYAETHSRGYLSGNYIEGNKDFTRDNYSAVTYTNSGKRGSTTREKFALDEELVTGKNKPITHSARQAYQLVLQNAGSSIKRDAVDVRIVAGIKDRTNRLIDSQDEVGGWPQLLSTNAPVDVDRDGMPDDWESTHGLNPNNPADRNNDLDRNGYTNLEEYLNSITRIVGPYNGSLPAENRKTTNH